MIKRCIFEQLKLMEKLNKQLELNLLGQDGHPKSSPTRVDPDAHVSTCSKKVPTSSSGEPSQIAHLERYSEKEAGTSGSTPVKHNKINQSIINNKRYN